MSNKTVSVIIDHIEHVFYGDELTSPEQQAILFLIDVSVANQEF